MCHNFYNSYFNIWGSQDKDQDLDLHCRKGKESLGQNRRRNVGIRHHLRLHVHPRQAQIQIRLVTTKEENPRKTEKNEILGRSKKLNIGSINSLRNCIGEW